MATMRGRTAAPHLCGPVCLILRPSSVQLYADALKGLEHLLRRDAPEQQPLYIRVGEWQTVRTHLLPLLQESPALDEEVGYRAVKVLVRLTLPLAPIVENRIVRLEHMQQYKVWMLEGDALMTLMFLLSKALATAAADRDEHQRNMIELGLTLIRNLLAVPDPQAAVNEYQRKLHDRCIMQMYDSLVLGQCGCLWLAGSAPHKQAHVPEPVWRRSCPRCNGISVLVRPVTHPSSLSRCSFVLAWPPHLHLHLPARRDAYDPCV